MKNATLPIFLLVTFSAHVFPALGGDGKAWKSRDNAVVSMETDDSRGPVAVVSADCRKDDFGWARLDLKGPIPAGMNGLHVWLKGNEPYALGVTLLYKEGGAEKKYRADVAVDTDWKEYVIGFERFRGTAGAIPPAELTKVTAIQFSLGRRGGRFTAFVAGLDFVAAPDSLPAGPVRTEMAGLPPHPRLLFDAKGLEDFKKKVARPAWQPLWQERLTGLDSNIGGALALPPRGGNWSHNYVCPDHGARLKRGKQTGDWTWEHTCPVGPHTLTGDPSKATLNFDGNVMAGIHGQLAGDIIDLALAFQVTGKEAYLKRAREIALAYGKKYRDYPLHNNAGKPGSGARVHSQPLSEASWLIEMLQGMDLVWDHFSPEEKSLIEKGLIRPALEETILKPRMGIHNIKCRLNSAVGLAGFLLGDETLLQKAMEDPDVGQKAQLTRGVQEDGAWLEGAWGYHFFTIEGLWPLVEAARHCGKPMDLPQFKMMFDAPMTLSTPTFVLPAFNDSGEVALPPSLYEYGYARFNDPRYAPILLENPRKSDYALWFGVDEVSGARVEKSESRNSTASGYGILQKGKGTNATWFCLKYGPHGGGHGHPDKLSFVLYSRGQNIAVDPGTRAYGSPIHGGWDKTTFAHNTLVIDGTNQMEATGKCLAFGSSGDADFISASAGNIAEGVAFLRTAVLLHENLLVVVDQVTSAKSHLYDFVWHQRGEWKQTPAGRPWAPGDAPGYRYVKDGQEAPLTPALSLGAHIGPGLSTVFTASSPGVTQVLWGTGVGANTEDRVPLAVLRQQASNTVVAWAVSLDGNPASISCTGKTDGATIQVVHLSRIRMIHVSKEGTLVKVE